jgi:putative endonuclease
MNLYFVYIIFSSSLNKYYVGYSVNIETRLIEHNSGISTFTSKASDWEFRWKKELHELLTNESLIRRIKKDYADLKQVLSQSGNASEKAARSIIQFLSI